MMLGLQNSAPQPTGMGDLSTTLANIQWTSPEGYFGTSDISQWGFGEWGTCLFGVYALYSVFFTTSTALHHGATRAGKIKRGFTS
jgi:hypothetical protein